MSDYDMPRSGSLKLKRVDHTIKKKKKKKEESMRSQNPNVSNNKSVGGTGPSSQEDIDAAIEAKLRDRNPKMNKTKAELRFLQMQEKNKEKKIIEKASKTHKMRVEEFNKHLDNLTEHFDIPKVSWTK